MTDNRQDTLDMWTEECKLFLIKAVSSCNCPDCDDGYCKDPVSVDDMIAVEETEEGRWIYLHHDEEICHEALKIAAKQCGYAVEVDATRSNEHVVEHFVVDPIAFRITR